MNHLEIILYKTEDGSIKIDAILQNETIWLTQNAMAELFGVHVPAISKHLKNIFEEGELQKEATLSKMETVQNEGGRQIPRNKDFYNLDTIIAVGYRVNSKRATQFRIWATAILKEYIIKGFAMDDERLKQSERWDYFDEWLERIRDIRASEKRRWCDTVYNSGYMVPLRSTPILLHCVAQKLHIAAERYRQGLGCHFCYL